MDTPWGRRCDDRYRLTPGRPGAYWADALLINAARHLDRRAFLAFVRGDFPVFDPGIEDRNGVTAPLTTPDATDEKAAL